MKQAIALLFLSLMTGTIMAQTTQGNITAQSSACATASTANSFVRVPLNANAATINVQVTGTFTATLQFMVSADGGATYVNINATPLTSTTAVTSTTGTGNWQVKVAGNSYFQMCASSYSSGTATVTITPSVATLGGGGGGASTFDQLGNGTNTTSNAMVCTSPCSLTGTGITAGAVAFNNVTAGTNANALVIGTGGTLATSGSGTITASGCATCQITGTTTFPNATTFDGVTFQFGGTNSVLAGDNGGSHTFTVEAGTGSGTGNTLNLLSQAPASGHGGVINITAANGAGAANKNGGTVNITAGNALNSGIAGNVVITSGTSPSGNNGNIQLLVPSGQSIAFNSGTTLAWNSDSGISRDSAGVIDIGTGAQGSKAGTINATTANFTGTLTLGTLTTTNGVALTNLAQIATNTVLGNSTFGTANVTALAVGGCSSASSALIWTTNTGFGCNTSVTAAAIPFSGITSATSTQGPYTLGSGASIAFTGTGQITSPLVQTPLTFTNAASTITNTGGASSSVAQTLTCAIATSGTATGCQVNITAAAGLGAAAGGGAVVITAGAGAATSGASPGGNVTLQGGNASVGASNGGSINLTAGNSSANGVSGSIVLTPGTPSGSTGAGKVSIVGPTYTNTNSFLSTTGTWNSAIVWPGALLVNITNTSSSAGSLLADFQLGAATQWNVDKAGNSTQQGNASVNGSQLVTRTVCANVTPVTVSANVSTDQLLMACTIPAGQLNTLLRTLEVDAYSIYSTAASSTAQLTYKIKLCTVSGCGSGTVVTAISIQTIALATVTVTNNAAHLHAQITTQTAGATASFEAHGRMDVDLGSLTTAADSIFNDVNTATVGTIDSTAQLFLQVTGAFSAANASNSWSQRQMIVKISD